MNTKLLILYYNILWNKFKQLLYYKSEYVCYFIKYYNILIYLIDLDWNVNAILLNIKHSNKILKNKINYSLKNNG